MATTSRVRAISSAARRVTPALAAGLAIAFAFAPGVASAQRAGCAGAQTPIGAASRGVMQRAVICLINAQRRDRGLPALTESKRLNRAAQGWTNAMVRHESFSHGSNFGARISAVGFYWSTIGENIASGFETPASVVSAWMGSPGHCQNILDPLWHDVGTGVDDRAIAGASTDPGTWTEDFGLWLGQRSPSGNWGPADGCPYG